MATAICEEEKKHAQLPFSGKAGAVKNIKRDNDDATAQAPQEVLVESRRKVEVGCWRLGFLKEEIWRSE